MNKQTKGIFIGIGIVTLGVSVLEYYRGETVAGLSAAVIGLSLLYLAFYNKKKEDQT